MKLRTKLLLLTIGSQLMMILAVLLYFYIMSPIAQLQREHGLIQVAARQAEFLQADLNRLTISGVESQEHTLNLSYDSFQKSVHDVGKAVLLPAINQEMKTAVEAIPKLREIASLNLNQVHEALYDLRNDLRALKNGNTDISFTAIILVSVASSTPSDIAATIQYHVNTLETKLVTANDALSMIVKVINQKSGIVTAKIAEIEVRSALIASILLVTVLVLVFGISFVMAVNISRSFRNLSKSVAIASTGDLTHRFGLQRKDEIGILSDDLDILLDNMNLSLNRIQSASGKNKVIRDGLIELLSESSNSVVEIEANSLAISQRMVQMDQMLESAIHEIGSMVGAINGFHGRLGMQNIHVNESVAAVTQMLASIENIDRITQRDRQAAEELVFRADQGKEIFAHAFDKVAEITDSVSSIQGMAAIIAGVASQTNILAMNAAIEAAHAGDFGKGFAVVADEIGKLASASAINSEEIARSIAGIVIKMNEAGSIRESTIMAFDVISERIREVSSSIVEIYSNVNEMQTGSRQILSAMESLRTTSSELTDESAHIEMTTQGIRSAMSDLGSMSAEVTSNIGEITTGIQLISHSVHAINDHTEELRDVGTDLDKAVASFQTRAELNQQIQ